MWSEVINILGNTPLRFTNVLMIQYHVRLLPPSGKRDWDRRLKNLKSKHWNVFSAHTYPLLTSWLVEWDVLGDKLRNVLDLGKRIFKLGLCGLEFARFCWYLECYVVPCFIQMLHFTRTLREFWTTQSRCFGMHGLSFRHGSKGKTFRKRLIQHGVSLDIALQILHYFSHLTPILNPSKTPFLKMFFIKKGLSRRYWLCVKCYKRPKDLLNCSVSHPDDQQVAVLNYKTVQDVHCT